MEGKSRSEIKKKMQEAGLPDQFINEKLPADTASKDAAPAKAAAPKDAKKGGKKK